MESTKRYSITAVKLSHPVYQRNVRKHINADNLLARVRDDFQEIPDTRAANSTISLDNALMSALESWPGKFEQASKWKICYQ